MKCNVKICHATNCMHNRFKHERLKECSLETINISTDGRCKEFNVDRFKGFTV